MCERVEKAESASRVTKGLLGLGFTYPIDRYTWKGGGVGQSSQVVTSEAKRCFPWGGKVKWCSPADQVP